MDVVTQDLLLEHALREPIMAFISDVDEVVKEVRKAKVVFVFMLFAKQRKPGRIQRSKTLHKETKH